MPQRNKVRDKMRTQRIQINNGKRGEQLAQRHLRAALKRNPDLFYKQRNA